MFQVCLFGKLTWSSLAVLTHVHSCVHELLCSKPDTQNLNSGFHPFWLQKMRSSQNVVKKTMEVNNWAWLCPSRYKTCEWHVKL